MNIKQTQHFLFYDVTNKDIGTAELVIRRKLFGFLETSRDFYHKVKDKD